MDTGGFLLLLQAAEILESPPYSETSEVNSSPSQTSLNQIAVLQKELEILANHVETTKNQLKALKPVLLMDHKNMVPIGSGRTAIPRNVYQTLDWSSYTAVTRKLLCAVFCRSELATHSLTGKPSNAFGGSKPSKKRLDPLKVNDIIKEVTFNCKVDQSLVRNVITTKCAEEARRYRLTKCDKTEKLRWFL